MAARGVAQLTGRRRARNGVDCPGCSIQPHQHPGRAGKPRSVPCMGAFQEAQVRAAGAGWEGSRTLKKLLRFAYAP